jgi:hypothetical protein
VERLANFGAFKHHTSIPILTREDQRLDLLLTSAEIQVTTGLFGVILLIKTRDGKNVLQEHLAHQ